MAQRNNCFCAFCRTPRRVNRSRHVSVLTVLFSAILAAGLSFIIWESLEVRVLVLFVLFIGIAEFLMHFRWRFSVVCQHCGFDPVLYIKNPAAASERVTQRLQQRSTSAMGIVQKLDIPVRSRSAESKALSKTQQKMAIAGKNLSKQV